MQQAIKGTCGTRVSVEGIISGGPDCQIYTAGLARLSQLLHYSFYGTLWLVANDVIIGSALCTFVAENAEHLAALVVYYLKVSCSAMMAPMFIADMIRIRIQAYGIKGLQDILFWLDNWPGGLKLNHELGKFFGDAFLFFTAFWEESRSISCLRARRYGMADTLCIRQPCWKNSSSLTSRSWYELLRCLPL